MNLPGLEQAVFTRLDTQVRVPGTVEAVYRVAPQSEESELVSGVFPYLSLGYVLSPSDTKDQTGASDIVLVHAWQRNPDNLARAAVCQAVYDSLHRHSLAISDTDYAEGNFVGMDEFEDPDGHTHHAVMRFRVTSLNT